MVLMGRTVSKCNNRSRARARVASWEEEDDDEDDDDDADDEKEDDEEEGGDGVVEWVEGSAST